MLALYTKNIHFSLNDDIYLHIDGLEPVLAGIFTVELKKSLVLQLSNHIKLWKGYLDDAITFAKLLSNWSHFVCIIYSFDSHAKLIYETKRDSKLPLPDLSLCRKGTNILFFVYRKLTNNDVHMNCYLFATRTWKSTWKAQSRQICIPTDKEPSNKQTKKQTKTKTNDKK